MARLIAEETYKGLVEYLSTQPWGQVNQLMVGLSQAQQVKPAEEGKQQLEQGKERTPKPQSAGKKE